MQAARALATQCRVLIEVCSGTESLRKLGAVAMHLQTYLASTVVREHGLSKDQIETFAHNLVLVAPAETRPKAAVAA